MVAAKTKAAPLEATSTPRLELIAAVPAVKLCNSNEESSGNTWKDILLER